MSFLKKSVLALTISTSLVVATASLAQPASSEKHAVYATELRQSVFKLLGGNMGPLGAMAKGKIPLDAKVVEKNAIRINQLSLMIADYTRTDTSKFDVKTEALAKIWQEPEHFSKNIDLLTVASSKLIIAAKSNNESEIKKAIGGVGKTCGGCHDDFKEE
ncbi:MULTISPECIES: c-type cytochrome [Colwellia]|uniref:Cytochrome c n=1 Tax=Colwellia psychrerythraea (strain 34H / ATCC BAA-681) TaxID=167879 RepID=Q480K8_COLP3|nr:MULTISPECIES: cytochrome c [Colwellia]AAZ27707.1 cytochrome c' [Colwellia psychrerythraea 34H]PKH87438.1 cytochrome C [Colwellia sp. Bg11-28]